MRSQLEPISGPFNLKPRVRVHLGQPRRARPVIRQRINLRTPLLAYVVRAMTLLLGARAGVVRADGGAAGGQGLAAHRQLDQRLPHLYHDAAGLTASDFTTARRLIAGIRRVPRLLGVWVSRVAGVPAPVPCPRRVHSRRAGPRGDHDRASSGRTRGRDRRASQPGSDLSRRTIRVTSRLPCTSMCGSARTVRRHAARRSRPHQKCSRASMACPRCRSTSR